MDSTLPHVPLNDLRRVYDADQTKLDSAVLSVLGSGRYLASDHVRKFADDFGAFLGVGFCLPVGNGTDALELALRALAQEANDGERREVIGVANAGGYMTTACLQCGLLPVFVDITETSQLMDIDAAVAAVTPRTLAIVVTHLYGGLVDVDALAGKLLAAGHGHVAILEDCAQAHGLEAGGRRVGTLGDIATFSFYPTKNLGAFGDAGAIVTSDAERFQRVKQLHQYGWNAGAKYRIAVAGARNSRMDEIQAAILGELLPRLDGWNTARRAILERYQAAAPEGISLVRSPLGTVAHLAVVLCDDREGLRHYLATRGIATDIHYPILDCDQPGWADHLDPSVQLPVARRSLPRLLTLPCFPAMTETEITLVCDALAQWGQS